MKRTNKTQIDTSDRLIEIHEENRRLYKENKIMWKIINGDPLRDRTDALKDWFNEHKN